MINKVNRPPHLTLVASRDKKTENNPGSSQGGGNAYERPPQQSLTGDDEREDTSTPPELAVVSELEKAGMTEVVTSFYEHKNRESITPASGLTTRYQADASPTKGLLLNKKAE